MYKTTVCLALTMSCLLTAFPPQRCNASEATDITSITDQIVIKELDLFKLNATVKLNTLPRSPWAARRWAAIGTGNNILTAVGAFQTGAGRFYWMNNTRKAPNNYFATAARSRLIANCLSVGGATVELAADGLAFWKEHKNGTDLGSSRRQAAILTQEIDDLLAKRAEALKTIDYKESDYLVSQQRVLQDMRDLADNEFARFYAQAKGGRITRNLGYMISWLSNFESGFGSAYSSLYAPYQTKQRPRFRTRNGGVGGITDIVSGSLNVAAPFLSRAGGALERMSAHSSVCKQLDCDESTKLADLQAHETEFALQLKTRRSLEVKAEIIHDNALRAVAGILNQHEAMRKAEQKAARNRFIENVVNSSVSGGTKIANGIGGAVGAFHYTRDSRARFMVGGEVSIAYGAGSAFSAMETLRNQFWNELTAKRARDQHKSTRQILNDQIAALETQEAAVKGRAGVKFAASPIESVQ